MIISELDLSEPLHPTRQSEQLGVLTRKFADDGYCSAVDFALITGNDELLRATKEKNAKKE